MATLYCNSVTGADANNGSTWSLAKKTLAAVQTAATAGDTIYAHGIFAEALAASKALTWIGSGFFVIDGGLARNGISNLTASIVLVNCTITNCIAYSVYYNSGGGLSATNCVFLNSPYGIYRAAYSAASYLRNCVFFNCATAGMGGATPSTNELWTLQNCVFSNNGIDIDFTTFATPVYPIYSAFRSPVMYKFGANAGFLQGASANNVFDFTVGKCIGNSADKTSLADLLTFVGSTKEINSIDRVWSADVGDYANGVLRSNPAGYLLTAAPGSTPIGLQLPGLTISNNKNATLWTGGVFSNTELDGSGYLVLSAGQTVGTWKSDIIDFGAAINAKSVEIALAGEAAALPYLDYDTADSPGYFNVRVRGSNTLFAKADASPSWVIVPRRAEIGAYMSNALRYWQIELTLRA